MSIEKLKLVNIGGALEHLNNALICCLESGSFHIENAAQVMAGASESFSAPSETDPYAEPLKKLLALNLQSLPLENKNAPQVAAFTPDQLHAELDRITQALGAVQQQLSASRELLAEYQNAVVHLRHLQSSNDDLGKLLQCKHIVCRFGRMPEESVQKLDFYTNQNFVFRAYDVAHEYAWGFYFCLPEQSKTVDGIMKALLFEEFHIPSFVHGTPEQALADLEEAISRLRQEVTTLEQQKDAILSAELPLLADMYRFIKYQHEVHKLRSQCVVSQNKFCLLGYVPVSELEPFQKRIEKVPGIVVSYEDPPETETIHPPVRLRSNWFTKPFSMFVEMYGLPGYRGFNPTGLLAITYTLLFGIMFGDLGQGLLMAVIGLILSRTKKIALAPILTRIGVSSAVFGFFYGSVFGYEHLLDPFFESIGLSFLPLHAMEHTTLFIYGAIGLGAGIMLLSILVNIIIKFRQRDYADAVFGNNGIMGAVFFSAILAIVVCMLMTDINLLTAPYIICLLILPLVCMFFREPLGALLAHKPFHKTTVGDFIASNFFECFEFLLGYATNMLSFIRVGGFVFSHAGLMSVVMVLADMVGKGASPIVVIIGNLFVMGLEGLIVGIQVLRLEFYEIFSRCYDGDGKPFTPIAVTYDEFEISHANTANES